MSNKNNILSNQTTPLGVTLSGTSTISALATPVGGAIAVIRISGPDAISITDKVFRSASGKPLSESRPNTLHYGEIYSLSPESGRGESPHNSAHGVSSSLLSKEGRGRSPGCSVIDDVVVSLYRAPHSYTGEDCVEISCHGSRYIVRQILNVLQENGTRQAEPGEYTRRAYLNGKMDLSQAEAVADIIAASNKASHDIAMSQLKGHVRSALEDLRERLQKLTALLELELDFSDHDDLEFADRTELKTLAHDIENRLSRLADTYRTGKAIKEGIPVAIVGKTNVGKSTLLNSLLGEDRAIVSDVPGTTRDSIEDVIDINGVAFRFVDTAGIRSTTDKVEKIGIDRAYDQINKASIILWVIDAAPSSADLSSISSSLSSSSSPSSSSSLFRTLLLSILPHPSSSSTTSHCDVPFSKPVIIVHNKADLTPSTLVDGEIAISAKTGTGIDALKEAIYSAANIPQLTEGDAIITSARQYGILKEALDNLHRVIDGLESSLPTDLVAEDLRLVLDNLADITGIDRITPATTLNTIFSHFCIGK